MMSLEITAEDLAGSQVTKVAKPSDISQMKLRPPKKGGAKMFGEISLLTGPALIVFVGFVIIPIIYAAYVGFFKWNGYGPLSGATLYNYKRLLTDPFFWKAVSHNFEIAALSLLVQGPLALVMALLLNRKMKGRGWLRVLLFVPYVIAEATVGVGWRLFLGSSGAQSGAINDFLTHIGLGGLAQYWLDKGTSLWVLLFICTWKYIGFAVILFLAGMQGIPEELPEAAAVDGASYWRTQWHITIPLLGPTIRIWAFLSIIGSLQLFDLVNVIWGFKNARLMGVDTMATYMFREGRDAQLFGYGNAVAAIMFLITLIVALLYQRFILRRDTAGALTGGDR